MDDLTRAIAEALADDTALTEAEWLDAEKASARIAAALAPLIEARVREARAEAAADAYADVMRLAADRSMACRRVAIEEPAGRRSTMSLPIHRTEAGYPNCSTCDGGGCHDCTDPA